MTLKELKEHVASSPNKEWLQNYVFKIHSVPNNYKQEIKGVVNIYEFVISQIEGFTALGNLPKEFKNILSQFDSAKSAILNLLEAKNIDIISWNNSLKRISGANSQPIFIYSSPETEFLITTYRSKPELFPAAYEYLIGSLSRVTSKTYFEGYLLAYEFSSKEFSKLTERKDAEEKAIVSTINRFQDKLGEAELEVVEYIDKSNKKFAEYSQKIDKLKEIKEKEFKDWYLKTVDSFNFFNNTSASKITSLQKTYEEKLKLEAPAQYWSQRAAKLRKEGWRWLWYLIGSLAISIVVLVIILNMTANGTLQKVFAETSTAIKWSVTLITLISFLAYGVRTFAKLTFSSFHLVRDAEEREQLTFVYLALQNEAKVDPTERHLIMQSLFSRADSGLLKDDGSPTMPGNIIDQAFKK